MDKPEGFDAFLASNKEAPAQVRAGAKPAGFEEFIAPEIAEEKHGSFEEKMKAGVEAIRRGATLGLSDVLQTKLGLSTPEDIKGRMEASPAISFIGSGAGTGALAALTGGANLVAAPLEGTLGALGSAAAGYGAEGAVIGAGNAISDAALGDGDLNAQKLLTHMGIGTALGVGAAGLGAGASKIFGKSGALKDTVSDTIGEIANAVNEDANVGKVLSRSFKENAPEIAAAAERLGAPISEGMVSDNPWVQKAEDALINGAPSYSAIKRAKIYNEGYQKVAQALDDIVPEGRYTKSETGEILQKSLAGQIADENAPISRLYDSIKANTQDIPLSENSLSAIKRNIEDLRELKISPSSPEGALASRVAREIQNLATVDDVKAYSSMLNRGLSPTASSGEKRMVGILADKLDNLEQSTIKRYAMQNAPDEATRQAVTSLIKEADNADALYKPFITKVKTLAEQLGKRKVYGPKDAISFINELDPEELTTKLFTKNSIKFLRFFEKNFPEQMAVLREYQKSKIREAATKTGEFSSKVFFNKVKQLEPEVQQMVFHPDELAKIHDAEAYIRSFPEHVNPSGTSHTSAFREFFESPIGAAIANARDFGIDTYIKLMGKVPDNLRPNAIEAGAELAQKFNHLNAAQEVIDKTNKRMFDNAKSIFTGESTKAGLLGGLISKANESYEKKVERIQELATNQDAMYAHLSNHTTSVAGTLPSVSLGVNNALIAATGFLNSKIPRPAATFAFSAKWGPSEQQKQKFERYYDAINDPISVLKQVKSGELTSESLEALRAAYPHLLTQMQSVVSRMINSFKDKKLPYSTKQSISQFLGRPLDESMLPQVVMSNQVVFRTTSQARPKPQDSALSGGPDNLGIAGRSKTETQGPEEEL